MNKELKTMFDSDQGDRHKAPAPGSDKFESYWKDYLFPRDKERQNRTLEILESGELEAVDYYHAAMVFQHSDNIKKAISLAKRSMNMGYEDAKWLFAAATDRYLVERGEKQKYGTQFKVSDSKTIEPYPVNEKTPDSEREKYNVPPIGKKIKELKEYYSARKDN